MRGYTWILAPLLTAPRTIRGFARPSDPYAVSGVPPLAVSPDERSLVLLAQDSESRHFFAVSDTYEPRSYTLPIDRRRMRFFSDRALGPDWVRHHFEWTKSAVASILVTELGAEAMPDGNYGFDKRVRLDGRVLSITLIESGPYVDVAYEGSGGEIGFMRSLAARLDAAFATRKWDAAFR